MLDCCADLYQIIILLSELIILKKYELSNAKKLEKKFKIIVFRGNGLFRSVITPYIESKMLFTNCFDYILENVDNSYF